MISKLESSCDVCNRNKKPSTKSIVGFPMAKVFSEKVAMDLKEWSPNVWSLHLINHATRFSSAIVIRSKKEEFIFEKVFQIWISIFGCGSKFSVDNKGKLDNEEFRNFCENLNINVCTTGEERSNGLFERHN